MSTDLHAKTALLSWVRFRKRWPYAATEVDVPGGARADVLASDGVNLVEFEVKTNLEDVKRDKTKGEKHMIYRNVSPVVQRDEYSLVKGDLVALAVERWEGHWATRVLLLADEGKEKAEKHFSHGLSYFADYNDHYETAEKALEAAKKKLERKGGVPNQLIYVVHESCVEAAMEHIPKEYGVVSFKDHRFDRISVKRKTKKLHGEPVGEATIQKLSMRMLSELANFHISMVSKLVVQEVLEACKRAERNDIDSILDEEA
jgi:hypothetical protein